MIHPKLVENTQYIYTTDFYRSTNIRSTFLSFSCLLFLISSNTKTNSIQQTKERRTIDSNEPEQRRPARCSSSRFIPIDQRPSSRIQITEWAIADHLKRFRSLDCVQAGQSVVEIYVETGFRVVGRADIMHWRYLHRCVENKGPGNVNFRWNDRHSIEILTFAVDGTTIIVLKSESQMENILFKTIANIDVERMGCSWCMPIFYGQLSLNVLRKSTAVSCLNVRFGSTWNIKIGLWSPSSEHISRTYLLFMIDQACSAPLMIVCRSIPVASFDFKEVRSCLGARIWLSNSGLIVRYKYAKQLTAIDRMINELISLDERMSINIVRLLCRLMSETIRTNLAKTNNALTLGLLSLRARVWEWYRPRETCFSSVLKISFYRSSSFSSPRLTQKLDST